ncbi:MAG TPA: tetratricopeptide repeat protein [Kofleriaceae bacterium]|nr:tetratricopeptide repeat protein [Kofleriaceae bacterium]
MKTPRTITASLVALAATALALPAGAQSTAKYKRSGARVDVKVKQTELTRGLKDKSTGKSEFVPEVTADQFINIQGKVKLIRGQQIAEYRRLIEETAPDDPELPDLLFRLAEQYAQQQRYWRFRFMEMYGKIEKSPKSQRTSLTSRQNGYKKEEEKFLTQAIKIYALIANNSRFKNYARMDEALFYYAYTLQGAKRVDLARKVYQQLIQNYPNSKFIPFAFLSFADYFFETNNLAQAEKFYDKVLEFPTSPVYAYALYKKGWVYLNLDRPQDALETFYEVTQKTRGKEKYDILNKASKKDFVRAYAEVGRPQKAYQAFERVDRSYAFNMLKILATIYLDQGKAEKTIYTHRELIQRAPKDQQVCEWEYNIVQAMITAGDNKQKADEVELLDKLYVKYRDRKILKGSALQECHDNAEGITYEMAGLWHQEVMKTLNFDTLAYVERLYEVFLSAFPDSEHHAEVQYYFSECLWLRAENEQNPRLATERWEKAAIAFTDVVKQGKVGDKLKKESAYAAVLGWKNALAVDPRTQTPEVDMAKLEETRPPAPKPINEREQKMIAAFDIYIKYIKDPNDEELVMMKFLKARILWTHDHLDDALPSFREIVDKYPKHEAAGYSAAIIRDSLIRMHRYPELGEFVTALLARADFWEDRDELKEIFLKDQGKVQRKVAEQLEKDGKKLACGQSYESIYNTNPDGPNMDEVLFSAGVCYEDAKSIGKAIQMYEVLNQRFPKSVHAQKALGRAGNAYAAIAFYDRSAGKYEQFAKKYGGESAAPAALQNAVTYRKGIGDDKTAVADIEFFVKQYKNKMKKDSADALWGLVGIYEKQGNQEMVIKALERYLKEMGNKGGRDRVVAAHARIGQILWEQSCRGKGVDGACIKVERERAVRRRGKRRHGTVLPDRCGESSKIKLTVIERDKKKAGQARAHFRQAISEYGKGASSDDPTRQAFAINMYAMSRFYMAEEQFEGFLGIEFPEKLDFSERNAKKKADSEKRFKKFLGEKEKQGGRANDAYKGVREVRGGGAAWAVAAAARIGQISQNAADALYTAEVPRDVRSGPYAEDSWDSYCDALTTAAGPLEERSVAGFSSCLETSTSLNWFNKWSKLCERELGQIRPQDFPTASELHAEPSSVAAITDTQGLVTAISGK